MSHTNSTTNYNLPQFLTSDKPAWLTDVNNAFSDIDTAIYAAQSKADTAYADAGNAQTDATTAINNAAAADAKASGAIASIESTFDSTTIYPVGAKVMYNSLLYRCIVAVVTPGPWTGSDNWERINVDTLISTVDNKVGSLASLSTSDTSSIVNAVNEVNGKANSILSNLGNRLIGTWSANTSTGNNVRLTNSIDVSAGTYLIVASYPSISTTNFVASLNLESTSSVYDNTYINGGSWAGKAMITAFSNAQKIYLASAQGAPCNFSNTERGSIRAIKLSSNY